MGAESIGKEIVAFLAAQLPDRCDLPMKTSHQHQENEV